MRPSSGVKFCADSTADCDGGRRNRAETASGRRRRAERSGRTETEGADGGQRRLEDGGDGGQTETAGGHGREAATVPPCRQSRQKRPSSCLELWKFLSPQLEIVQISPTAGDYQRVCLSLSLAFCLSVCISLSLIVCLRVWQSVFESVVCL